MSLDPLTGNTPMYSLGYPKTLEVWNADLGVLRKIAAVSWEFFKETCLNAYYIALNAKIAFLNWIKTPSHSPDIPIVFDISVKMRDKWFDAAQALINNDECRQVWVQLANIPSLSPENEKERSSALHSTARNLTGSFFHEPARAYILSAKPISFGYWSKAEVENVLHCIARHPELLAKFI